MNKRSTSALLLASALLLPVLPGFAAGTLELSDEPVPYKDDDDLPARTAPPVELGPDFLATGNIGRGFTLPTGAVWTPSLWVYGNFRTAIQSYQGSADNAQRVTEWANRLDVFANLQLSGTERVLIGFTPLHDRDTGVFSGKVLSNRGGNRTINETNADIDTLFFEGDFAELFPNLDRKDSSKNDIGFTIGRQNVLFMNGFLVNDTMDGVGLSKNNIRFEGNPDIVNWRSSVFAGLRGVNRNDNQEDNATRLYGWFNQIDTTSSTINVDLVFADGDESGDVLNLGVDMTRRFGKLNATFRAAVSEALGHDTPQSDSGVVLFAELSYVPAYGHNNLYLNGFVGIDHFTSAARGPTTGGPLGRTGLLFAAQNLGSYPAPLNNRPDRAQGVAAGYQRFFNKGRQQLVVEAGARFENDSALNDEYAVGVRYQHALGRQTLVQLDGYAAAPDGNASPGIDDEVEYGFRLEFQVKF